MDVKKFPEYSRFDLSQINKDVLKKWDDSDIFHRSMKIREGAPSFVFYEGPPSANGMPGIHHVLSRTIKDIFCRYKTMKGFHVKRKAGWDTHGLPVELGVEKTLGITKEDIGKKISIAEYNATCRKEVMKYTKEWSDLTHRMGYWVDLDDPYITYDNRYIETLWWLLRQLYDKGLLYKGYTIQPYSPAAGTGLSSHELNQPGCYRDVKDTTVTAQFLITTPKGEMTGWGNPYFLAWTTTPWTLPSNTALCVGPKIDYVAVQTYNPYTGEPMTAVLAKALVASNFNPKGEGLDLDSYKKGDKVVPYRIVAEYKGTDLEGMHYEQLLPWVNPGEGAFRVILGDYVSTDDGTGIVHIAPTFGADDAFVAKAAGVPPLQLINKRGEARPMVDLTGKFYLLDELDEDFVRRSVNVGLYKQYEGRFVKNAYDPNLTDKDETLDISICMELKAANKAFKIEKHTHNYPHCWRTDKPIIYYPLDSWFIRSTACKDRMIALNKTINWKPESTGTGRFGKWLESLNDWNLSRSRYWGTPLPIWRTEDNSEEKCIGSVEELYNEIEKAVAAGVMKENPFKDFTPGLYTKDNYDKIDLHRPYVDDITLISPSGRPMYREKDLIDVWFDSGSMPFAQAHYPFEHKEEVDKHIVYPADFIAEGVDQTRGWFYTLHAISTMVFDQVSFKAVISNGLVLDKNGNKMSKRLGNAVDPFKTIEENGSDPLRWYIITNASPWDNLKFDMEGVEEVKRKFFGTLYNTYSFFALYANVDGFDANAASIPLDERPEIDRWILSELNSLIRDVQRNLDDYEPTKAGRLISAFVNDNLSNWYVRLNRKRFWGGGQSKDKTSAYETLYTCLLTVAKLMAPIAPFYADRLYCDLTRCTPDKAQASVHLTEFPVCDEAAIDTQLERKMELAQQITSMVLALRRKVNIKVRQPLQSIMIPVSSDPTLKAHIEAVKTLILNEVNVKELNYVDNTSGILVKSAKCDFKKLGPKFGKQMKDVSKFVAGMTQDDIVKLETDGAITFELNGQPVTLTTEDIEIHNEDIPGWLVANEGKLTVALEVELTDELRHEGIARELVNRIQNMRKSSNFDITDKINVAISRNETIEIVIKQYNTYICNQVLAENIIISDNLANGVEADLDFAVVKIAVEKI